jgi:hypothetical protein
MAPLLVGLISYGPTLIRMVGGLFGGKTTEAANTVADLVDQVKGLPSSEANEKIAAELRKLPPEVMLELEKVRVRLAEIDNEREATRIAGDTARLAAETADRASARARDTDLQKANGGYNTRADVMVIGAVVGLISCLGVLIFFRGDIPGEVVGIVSMIAGIFGACLKDAYAFEFGSSRGSKEKDALLGEIARMP